MVYRIRGWCRNDGWVDVDWEGLKAGARIFSKREIEMGAHLKIEDR